MLPIALIKNGGTRYLISGNLSKAHFQVPARDFEFGNTPCAYSLTQVRLGFCGLIRWVFMQWLDLKGFPQPDEVRK